MHQQTAICGNHRAHYLTCKTSGTLTIVPEPVKGICVAGLHSWVRPATSTASVRSVGHIVVPDKLQKAVRTLSIASVYKALSAMVKSVVMRLAAWRLCLLHGSLRSRQGLNSKVVGE